MSITYISLRNLRFVLHEVLDLSTVRSSERFAGFDREAIDLSLDAAGQLADRYLYPAYREMDRDKAYFSDGEVHVLPAVGEGMRALGEAGWLSAAWGFEHEGQQMPLTVNNAGSLIFQAANGNLAAYGFLTTGAANLIREFGSEELKQTYLPQMAAGRWQGTMALTEPQAGSSLSDISTSYELLDDGSYRIHGQKIYISGGDHTGVDNVVHLLLARQQDGPAGMKGVSLFVVPKYLPGPDGLTDNHVTTAGIYGKMGQKGYVAAHLMFGEQGVTKGYLVGGEFRGLQNMFLMMNEARIGTGMMAAGSASAAYYASLQYAKERPQGRHPDNKDVNTPQVTIIEHADVRRMLLFQKSVVEGSIMLLLQCSLYEDHYRIAENDRDRLLLELLTPIAKSFPSEYGNEAVSLGMQVLGGAGYTDDFPLEQIFRDIRVNSIYEGTTDHSRHGPPRPQSDPARGHRPPVPRGGSDGYRYGRQGPPWTGRTGRYPRAGNGTGTRGDHPPAGQGAAAGYPSLPCRRYRLPRFLRADRDRLAVAPTGRGRNHRTKRR